MGEGDTIFTNDRGRFHFVLINTKEHYLTYDSACTLSITFLIKVKREFRKTGPDVDMSSVDQKMALTFSYRRKLVVNEKMSVADLTEKFPWLKLRCEVNTGLSSYVSALNFTAQMT